MTVYVCSRCQRTTEDLPVDWEVMDSKGDVVVCGGCLTREEQKDVVEGDMKFIDEMKRQGRWEDGD
jgi:DNA-directed RNA polymerase subunit RPC12/RpoP